MKRSFILLATFYLFSCNKDSQNNLFTAGDEQGMDIVALHQSVNGHLPTGLDYVENLLALDLDNDGTNDLRFRCISDSIHYPNEFLYKRMEVNILNDLFELVYTPNSGLAYQKVWEEDDYYGTFPRKTIFHQYSCAQESGYIENGDNLTIKQNAIRYFNTGEAVVLDNLNWTSNSVHNMTMTSCEYAYYEFTSGFDSLVGPHDYYPNFCNTVAFDIPMYLVFRKTLGSAVNYGWIRIEITNTNDLYIHSIGTLID